MILLCPNTGTEIYMVFVTLNARMYFMTLCNFKQRLKYHKSIPWNPCLIYVSKSWNRHCTGFPYDPRKLTRIIDVQLLIGRQHSCQPMKSHVENQGYISHRTLKAVIMQSHITALVYLRVWHGLVLASVRSLQWRHNGRDSVSNHQPHDCLLNRLFRRRSTKISKLRVTGLCVGNSPGTGEFPAQRASNAENVSIWWRHPVLCAEYDHSSTLQISLEYVARLIINRLNCCRLKGTGA